MIIDSRLEFSVGQVLAGAGASTNVVDLSTDRHIGPGRTMYVVVQTEAVAAADVAVSLQTSDTESSGYASIASVTIPDGTPAGTRFVIGMPYSNKRYLRLNYGAAITASAWLTDQEPASWRAYPDA